MALILENVGKTFENMGQANEGRRKVGICKQTC